MVARVFRGMGRVFRTAFGEGTWSQWRLHDRELPADIKVIFNARFARRDIAGVEISEAAPTAWVRLADARAIESSRPLDRLFDQQDSLVIGGEVYAVESCTPDGYEMIEIILSRRSIRGAYPHANP